MLIYLTDFLITHLPVQRLLDDRYNFSGDNLGDILIFMYGVYMAKREENIRRQLDDPRYTGRIRW